MLCRFREEDFSLNRDFSESFIEQMRYIENFKGCGSQIGKIGEGILDSVMCKNIVMKYYGLCREYYIFQGYFI